MPTKPVVSALLASLVPMKVVLSVCLGRANTGDLAGPSAGIDPGATLQLFNSVRRYVMPARHWLSDVPASLTLAHRSANVGFASCDDTPLKSGLPEHGRCPVTVKRDFLIAPTVVGPRFIAPPIMASTSIALTIYAPTIIATTIIL